MAELLRVVGNRTIEYLRGIGDEPANASSSDPQFLARCGGPLPREPERLDALLDLLFGEAIPRAFNAGGPSYLAYIPGGGLFSGAVGDFVASAVNRYVGVWAAAPGAVEMESATVRWIAELLGCPPETRGVLTTGGSMSNLLAFVAARDKLAADDVARCVVYVSEESHYSIAKAARIAGVMRDRVRSIEADSSGRIKLDALAEAIGRDRSDGLRPLAICGTAGTVNTGVVDPLDGLADIAESEGLWFHVDGAYGAVFRMVPGTEAIFRGMERADSIAVDPHKGLFFAYGTGALLVRDLADLRRAFADQASYLPESQGDDERIDFFDVSPELSRNWRGLPLWLAFKLHGTDAFRRALAEKMELARSIHDRIAQEPDVDTTTPELSLFTFHQRHDGCSVEEENRRNRELLGRINATQRVYLTGTTIRGQFWIRVCVLHFRTHRDRVEEATSICITEIDRGR